MEIKRLRVLVPIICILALSVLSMTIFAQSGASSGCIKWNGLTNASLNPSFGTGVSNQLLSAGEILQASITLNSPGSATVRFEGASSQSTTITSNGSLSFNVPVDGIYSLLVRNTGVSTSGITVNFACQPVGQTSASLGNSAASSGFTDDRINYLDAAAPIAVYSYRDDTGLGYDIYSPEGVFILRMTGANMANLPVLDANSGIYMSRTAGGGYQITAPQYNGKTYYLQFDVPLANIGYTSWEQD